MRSILASLVSKSSPLLGSLVQDARLLQHSEGITQLTCLRQFTAYASEAHSASHTTNTCWNCGNQVTGNQFFCPSCNRIQPPASSDEDTYRMFGMQEPVFDVDNQQIEQAYKDLQKELHPDKYATASKLEREYSAEQATAVNMAYDVLRHPLRRAHFLLQHHGHGACEGLTITDPELLGYVMEKRADIEETTDRKQLESMKSDVDRRIQQCVDQLKMAFGKSDFDLAAELTTQLRYLVRIREAIIEKL